ncbi:hypothetical protein ACI65C_006320 [Semiaphis heraclei]
MKKFNSLSYRTKKRRINEELQSHFSNVSSLEGSFTINNSITSGEQITENLVPNNCDLLPENNISTNNAYLNIQELPLIPESSNEHSDSESYPNIDSLLDDNLTFDTENLQEAKAKVRKAEKTSDLSTSEDIQNKTRRKTCVVEDAPIFTGISNTDVLSISCSSDYPKSNSNMPDNINLTCPTLKVRKKLFHTTTSAISSQKDFLIPSFNNEQKYNIQHLSSTVPRTSDELHDYRTIDVPTRNPKDYDRVEDSSSPNLFDFKNDSSSDTNDSIDKMQKSTVIHTTSSPFKVTLLDSTQFETTAPLNTLKKKGSDIKISSVENSSGMFSPSSSSVHRSLNRNCTTPNTILNISDSNDTLKKILSVVLKIKYDVENLTHNQNRMDNILNDLLTNDRSVLNQGDSVTVTINDDNDYSLMLPLHNEEELSDFENKLLNKSFRLNVIKF